MLPAECFVNSQKFQEAKVHKGSSLGLPDHAAISRHNSSALDREAAEANTVGQLTCLPERKQTPKQTYIHTANTHTHMHTHCHQWHGWCRTENGEQAMLLPTIGGSWQIYRRPVCKVGIGSLEIYILD